MLRCRYCNYKSIWMIETPPFICCIVSIKSCSQCCQQSYIIQTLSVARKWQLSFQIKWAKIPVASRHDTTRHSILPIHFGTEKKSWRDVTRQDDTCRACRAARRDTLVTTSATDATRTTRVQGSSPQRGLGWTYLRLTLFRSCSWDCRKSRAQKTKLVHASTTAYSSPAILEQARRNIHDKRATRTTRPACRVVTWRNRWNLSYRQHDEQIRSSPFEVTMTPVSLELEH